ncbi:MAG: hypothetical protein IPN34_13380 [Planctomycetes bacterium]|nr:hypothetical protein [Planctomycetota bacterium]
MRWLPLTLVAFGTVSALLVAAIAAWNRSAAIGDIDRHTGRAIVRAPRREGRMPELAFAPPVSIDASALRYGLRGLREALQMRPGCARGAFDEQAVAALITAELSAPGDAPSDAHPWRAEIRRETSSAAAAREQLATRRSEELAADELLPLLVALEADLAIAEATESFFALFSPSAHPHETRDPLRTQLGLCAFDIIAGHAAERWRSRELAPDEAQRLAQEFAAQARPRTELRWRLRAFAADPSDAAHRIALAEAYQRQGRTLEAFHVLGAALASGEPSPAEVEGRLVLASWLDLDACEARALRFVLERNPSDAVYEHLVQLELNEFDFSAAADTLMGLAARNDDLTLHGRAATLYLQAGRLDDAIAALRSRAERFGHAMESERRIAALLLEEVRIDDALVVLRRAEQRWPRAGFDVQLEALLRRFHHHEELRERLERKVERGTHTPEELEELIALEMRNGRLELVRRILSERASQATTDPHGFVRSIPLLEEFGIEGVEKRLEEVLALESLDQPQAIELLYGAEGLREALFELVTRRLFARYPYAKEILEQRLAWVDRGENDRARLARIRGLTREHPRHPLLMKAWIDRATWAGDLDEEIRARETWRSMPNIDWANVERLAELYEARERYGGAVEMRRLLAQRDGLGSAAERRYVGALLAFGDSDRAIEVVRRWVELDPNPSAPDRDQLAELCLQTSRFAEARRHYTALLPSASVPADPTPMLRLGQIALWTGDSAGAESWMHSYLGQEHEARPEALYGLGEALWSLRRRSEARAWLARAADAWERASATGELDPDDRVNRARALMRLERHDEGLALFEEELRRRPGVLAVELHYLEGLRTAKRYTEAERFLAEARRRRPGDLRWLRAEADLDLDQLRYGAAIAKLLQLRSLAPDDHWLHADLGLARRRQGEYQEAFLHYDAARRLRPNACFFDEPWRELRDEVVHWVQGELSYRTAGSDRTLSAESKLSWLIDEDRHRWTTTIREEHFSGVSTVGNGRTDQSITTLGNEVAYRFEKEHVFRSGFDVYFNDERDVPVGAWARFEFLEPEPYTATDVALELNDLFDVPAAAPAFGGWRHRASVRHTRRLSEDWFAFGSASLALQGIEPPSGPRADDTFFAGLLGLGVDLIADDPSLTVQLEYLPLRVLGDKELVDLLPLAPRNDYLTLRAQTTIDRCPDWKLFLEGFVGQDLHDSSPILGVQGRYDRNLSDDFWLWISAGYSSQAAGRAQGDAWYGTLGLRWRF